ncbi:hypothetical protein HAX54_019075, partial [Datura stramonium]|nr:hypothetical protein [Datura stramonium]
AQLAGGCVYSRYIALCFQKPEIELARHQMCQAHQLAVQVLLGHQAEPRNQWCDVVPEWLDNGHDAQSSVRSKTCKVQSQS